ncbi:MAG: lipid-binding SYLF domain-containing protein [Isosphaeraceae bacterium]
MTSAIAMLLLVLPAAPQLGAAKAREHDDRIMLESVDTIDSLVADPKVGITRELVNESAGVAIIPTMVRAGLIVGGRGGRGTLLVRTADGGWSNPMFISVGGASFGLQAGATASEVVLVFRTRKSVDRFFKGQGQFNLGGDVGFAVGTGRDLGTATDLRLKSEILQYSRSQGFYAGASLQGANVKLDWNANFAYYGDFTPPEVLVKGRAERIPEPAFRLMEELNSITTPDEVAAPAVVGVPVVIESNVPATIIPPRATARPVVVEEPQAEPPAVPTVRSVPRRRPATPSLEPLPEPRQP